MLLKLFRLSFGMILRVGFLCDWVGVCLVADLSHVVGCGSGFWC